MRRRCFLLDCHAHAPCCKLLLQVFYLAHQVVELRVDVIGAPLDEVLLSVLRVPVLLQQVKDDFLERFVFLEHGEADLEALGLGVVEHELTQVHIATTCADQNASAFDLNVADLSAHKVPARAQFDEGQASCKFVDQALVFLLQ